MHCWLALRLSNRAVYVRQSSRTLLNYPYFANVACLFVLIRYENNRWIQLTSMLVDRAHFAIVPVGDALYALGGMTERMEKGRCLGFLDEVSSSLT